MARKPNVGMDELYEIATYLARPETKTDIHAELHPNAQGDFNAEYAAATDGYPLPPESDRAPYYIWHPNVNKFGRQLRIYFLRVPPEPPPIQSLYTDKNKWRGGYRINHSNLVMQLFECGFVLGSDQNGDRIEDFMRCRFPVPSNGKK